MSDPPKKAPAPPAPLSNTRWGHLTHAGNPPRTYAVAGNVPQPKHSGFEVARGT